MPKVQEQGNSIPSSLHYALTDSQCNKCGAQLEWNAEFNDINSPKYTSQHCGQDYLITIDSVKVEMVKHSITEQGTKENKNNSELKENEKPNAISMAEDLKNYNNNKPPLQRKAKLGDGSHIAAEDR
jgi:NAD-dependent SIR2 family protein deacetylase